MCSRRAVRLRRAVVGGVDDHRFIAEPQIIEFVQNDLYISVVIAVNGRCMVLKKEAI